MSHKNEGRSVADMGEYQLLTCFVGLGRFVFLFDVFHQFLSVDILFFYEVDNHFCPKLGKKDATTLCNNKEFEFDCCSSEANHIVDQYYWFILMDMGLMDMGLMDMGSCGYGMVSHIHNDVLSTAIELSTVNRVFRSFLPRSSDQLLPNSFHRSVFG